MQLPKVRKTLQKPTIRPCGSTANAPKSSGQSTFDAGVYLNLQLRDIVDFVGVEPEKINSACHKPRFQFKMAGMTKL
jgi:hypothetical protein